MDGLGNRADWCTVGGNARNNVGACQAVCSGSTYCIGMSWRSNGECLLNFADGTLTDTSAQCPGYAQDPRSWSTGTGTACVSGSGTDANWQTYARSVLQAHATSCSASASLPPLRRSRLSCWCFEPFQSPESVANDEFSICFDLKLVPRIKILGPRPAALRATAIQFIVFVACSEQFAPPAILSSSGRPWLFEQPFFLEQFVPRAFEAFQPVSSERTFVLNAPTSLATSRQLELTLGRNGKMFR